MNKIHLSQEELKIVREILKDRKDACIFGSRAKGTHKKLSDLDICLKNPISAYEYEILQEKLEESDLPFKVDIVEFDKISDSFKKIIDKKCISLWE